MKSLAELLESYGSGYLQAGRQFGLQLGDGQVWSERLLPHALEGEEGLSQSYRYRVECLSPDVGLELKSLLGLAAALTVEGQDGAPVVRCGVVSGAEALASDGGFARYALTLEPPLALLKLRHTSRVFQDLTPDAIIRQILDEHRAANPVFAAQQQLDFHLTQPLSPRSYCLQYRETDYDFIVRLLHEEGLAWRFDHSQEGTPHVTLVAFDDPYAVPAAPLERVRFHRSDATEQEDGLSHWESQRQVVSSKVSLASFDYQPVTTLQGGDGSHVEQGKDGQAAGTTLEDYDPQSLYYAQDPDQLERYARLRQQAHDRSAKAFTGQGTVRGLLAGQWFRLDDHPALDGKGSDQREFVVTRQQFAARNNLPGELAQQLPPSLLGQSALTSPTAGTSGAGSLSPTEAQPFQTHLTAQRRGLPLTPAYAHSDQAKPTARGAQTATVVGPSGEEVHTDAQGRIKVQFHWQRPDEHPTVGANRDDTSSCWLRVAMPSAGAAWGHQFIPRIGQEVLVDFLEGDIDRPLITGVLYNGSHLPPTFSGAGTLPANKTLSGIKSKEHQGGQYNELLFDDTPGEVRAKLSSEHGKTQLNQGFLTHPRTEGKATPRGDGFELRTDRQGALRAGQGLLLSTETQANAGGKQLARSGIQHQLESALALSQALGENATHQLADTVETGPEQIQPNNAKASKTPTGHLHHQVSALKAWEGGSNTDPEGKTAQDQTGRQPLMILSAPGGLAAGTEQSATVSAGTNLDLIAQRDTQQTSGRRWLHNVGQHISLFVAGVKDQIALKLIAAKGKVQVQAQSDALEITADKDVTITSCKNRVVVAAKEEILLACGGGYIRIKGGNIDIHCPGSSSFKAGNYLLTGPTNLGYPLPWFKTTHAYSVQFKIKNKLGEIQKNMPYKMYSKTGLEYVGKTDNEGMTKRIYAEKNLSFFLEQIYPKSTDTDDIKERTERFYDDDSN
ncbi:type VI secretion system Vgr family protein [Azospira inquinata]|uniref:Type VI secretion system tip protein VgrG n=1 Tax=Azospira inquinata TaxID=2785627 RepID=A0A975SQJ1_9RHOO|nr:type VI secretion system Vgr family protein [Azospira inquinata]QWT46973.1 type VI secretion system tip protein VgrG [Azospira inquinata]QWT50396.1 type VI secretion system tip protein VgrG [Azospira inquinata]